MQDDVLLKIKNVLVSAYEFGIHSSHGRKWCEHHDTTWSVTVTQAPLLLAVVAAACGAWQRKLLCRARGAAAAAAVVRGADSAAGGKNVTVFHFPRVVESFRLAGLVLQNLQQ